MDASLLVVVFLLVTAASLASYLLSQWSFIRNMSFGWVAISIGTIMLLAAATIVVLTLGLLPTMRLWPNVESVRKSLQFDRGTAERVLDRQEAPAEASISTSTATAQTDRGVSPDTGRNISEDSEHRSGIETASALSSQQPAGTPREAKSGAVSHGVGLVFTEADPWAATSCVYAFNPDPSDLTRWTIDNGCGAPVGIVFASCSQSPAECNSPQSTWEYQIDGMILPGKAQRPVTDKEETQYGSHIRYVACMVAAPLTIELIGRSSESRSSPSWLEQFDAARKGDECLTRVQKWSDAGRDSGEPIDVLLGANAPGKVHPAPTSGTLIR